MNTAVRKLVENIDQLVIWLKANPGISIPITEKNRLAKVCEKILNGSAISDAEKQELEGPLMPRIVLNKMPKQVQSDRVKCEYCGAILNPKNISRHREKCNARKISVGKKKVNSSQKLSSTRGGFSSENNVKDEYKETRRLDGSRDYWKIRDQGKFGSHSSYDDMGDESFS